MMKKILRIFIWLFALVLVWWNFIFAQNSSPFNNPIKFLDQANYKANTTDPIQNTDLNQVNSKSDICGFEYRFTFSRTLCFIKENIKNYLDYVLYIWLTAATILIIRNGFQLVTASNWADQMKKFQKNLIYIVIWVVLLIWFYYILELFVSVVNLVWKA